MAFDKSTRNRLASFVGEARNLIADEFTQQFQSIYGISEKSGITALDQLGHLDDAGLSTATLLRERIEYLVKTHPDEKDGTKAAVERLAREQAFTVLNRLAAIRMAEKRDLIVESVDKGYQSKGFKVFEQVAGSGLGDTYNRYRRYLFCLFDELAVDLGVLFDRSSPQGLLFPREPALLALLDVVNAPDLDSVWAEDETIGWIYQYYNDPAERKKMREESAAPRNSRELAVRNQFFTPRYVVEFLTDNTLGRIWYEMTLGQTRLKDQCRYLVHRPNEIFLKPGETAPERSKQNNLSQEDVLKQPMFIRHRAIKDPREIRMLDPACGSMHFGLYAFDLFEVIYDEAWEIAHGNDQARKSSDSFALFVSFAGGYADKAAFLADVPQLIIGHNIHGIDIDPRCAQIAGLSLWLRAQKSWQVQKVSPVQRPPIRRSNVVCAEPMPGNKAMLRDFVQDEFSANERPAFSRLLETIFDKMQLAGEAGSLLKIEEEIRTAVEEARKRWEDIQTKPRELFSTEEINRTLRSGAQQKLAGLEQAVSQVASEFWETAEERIYVALRDFAEQAENGGGFQRRLFAEDAARGFSFIDVCRKRYDVALMNPPFGEISENSVDYLRSRYQLLSENLYCGFITRVSELCSSEGIFGAITDRSYLIKQSFEGLRRWMIETRLLVHVVDLGWGVLDANVETCSAIFHQKETVTSFADISMDGDNRSERLVHYCGNWSAWILQNIGVFENLPFSAFAYSMPLWMRLGYEDKRNRLSSHAGRVCRGMAGANAEQLYRTLQEVDAEDIGADANWIIVQKGSPYSPFYYSPDYLLLHEGGTFRSVLSYDAGRITGREDYGKAGLAFGKRTDLMYAFTMNAGQVFSVEGQAIFPLDGVDPWQCLAILNSSALQLAVNAICGQHKLHGYVNAVHLNFSLLPDCSESAKRIWVQFRNLDMENELSLVFVLPLAAKASSEDSFQERLEALLANRWSTIAECKALHSGINKSIAISLKAPPEITDEGLDYSIVRNLFGQDGRLEDETHNFTTWVIGVVFGRWDIRYATGERAAPELLDPFVPLPVCPPGQLQNAQGLPARPEDAPAAYPVRIPWDGILVDDPNHPLDIERRVREVIEIIWKGRAEAIEHEACEILGVKSLRDYFRKPAGFFADHLKRYSKSRRQAPIYWPLSTTSGGYTLWIYYHRLTENTLHTALADFIDPKLKSLREEISYVRNGGNQPARVEELSDLEQELKDFRAEIERIIKLPWKPNLNDGVLITACPLWKLFRLPKWQKDLKACWEELSEGEYDWAHLAYTIWPDRVEDTCKTDRSIAIAHGLGHLCVVEAPKQKSKRKKAKDASFEGLDA